MELTSVSSVSPRLRSSALALSANWMAAHRDALSMAPPLVISDHYDRNTDEKNSTKCVPVKGCPP